MLGIEFNRKYENEKFYVLTTDDDENGYGYQYKDGINICEDKKNNQYHNCLSHTCFEGYFSNFCSASHYIHIKNFNHAREVIVPDDAYVLKQVISF